MFSRLLSRFGRQFKWPGRRFLYSYSIVIAVLALWQAVYTLMVAPSMPVHTASDPVSALLHNLAEAGVLSFALLVFGAMFYVIIALYYRIGTEIYQGWLSFKAAVPGIVSACRRGVTNIGYALSAIVNFVFSLPMRVASGYARLCAMSAFERYMLAVFVTMLLLVGCIFWQMWPVSTNLAAKLPDWIDQADKLSNLRNVLFIDCMLSMLLVSFVMPIYASLAKVLGKALFKKS